jgi:hypothetical protein
MLDRAFANKVLDALHTITPFSEPTAPLKVRLMIVMGTATTNGTELSTGAGGGAGAGYTAGGATLPYSASSGGSAGISASVTWTNMPACTIFGIEVWDSAGTPLRVELGTFSEAKVVPSGDSFTLSSSLYSAALS